MLKSDKLKSMKRIKVILVNNKSMEDIYGDLKDPIKSLIIGKIYEKVVIV